MAAAQIKALVANGGHGLYLVQATAPQLTKSQQWFALVRYIVEQVLACAPKPNIGQTALGSEQLTRLPVTVLDPATLVRATESGRRQHL
jgi:hypothetical protein